MSFNQLEDKNFPEVSNDWNFEALYMKLASVNNGKPLTITAKKFLRGILLAKTPDEIAKECGYPNSDTVRQYLSGQIYPLIRSMLNLSEKEKIIYSKVPVLLREYRFHAKDCLSEEEKNNESYTNQPSSANWQTLKDIEKHLEVFEYHCNLGQYLDAFYLILDIDDYDNSIVSFLNLHGHTKILVTVYEKLTQFWQPQQLEKWEFSIAIASLGNAYRSIGEYGKAIECHQKSLSIAEEIGDYNTQVGALVNLGLLYYLDKSSLEEALKFCRSGLYMARQLENRYFESDALNYLGLILQFQGELYKAIDYHYHSLEIKRQLNDISGVIAALINIADNHRILGAEKQDYGEYRHAFKFLLQAINSAQTIEAFELEARAWLILGMTKEQLGQKLEVLQYIICLTNRLNANLTSI
ncbi:tetratricopeptide repeat protein [Nostoc sp. C117]|uniref:tetratricopeptide repeat protein n=1 Tax=Nostoc sp. C117 TaxID=3349875 RepID=UPI00370DA666